MDSNYMDRLRELGACHEAKYWVETQNTPQEAWDKCQEYEWMSWWMYRVLTDEQVNQLVDAVMHFLNKHYPDLTFEKQYSWTRADELIFGDSGCSNPMALGVRAVQTRQYRENMLSMFYWLDTIKPHGVADFIRSVFPQVPGV